MDIGEILKDYFWLILAILFYLFAGRNKKKKEEEKKASRAGTSPQARPAVKSGLQERLEQALREMQEHAGQETGGRPAPQSAGQTPRLVVRPAAAPAASMATAEANVTVPEPGVAESTYESGPAISLRERRTALDAAAAKEEFTESTVPDFREGHGLRYHAHVGEMAPTGSVEFHEAHGLHFGQAGLGRSGIPATPSILDEESIPLFHNEDDIRRAIIAAEILGPPKARIQGAGMKAEG